MKGNIYIPQSALTDDLWETPYIGRFYFYLLRHVDDDGHWVVSFKQIQRDLGLSRQQYRTAINRLKSSNLLDSYSENQSTLVVIADFQHYLSESKLSSVIKIFDHPQYGDIRRYVVDSENKSPNFGFIYGIEFGYFVKIGCSQNPANRLMALRRQVCKSQGLSPGRMVISPPCSNYKELEQVAHIEFRDGRLPGSELFVVDFDNVATFFKTLLYR